jgi:hypothetical protein
MNLKTQLRPPPDPTFKYKPAESRYAPGFVRRSIWAADKVLLGFMVSQGNELKFQGGAYEHGIRRSKTMAERIVTMTATVWPARKNLHSFSALWRFEQGQPSKELIDAIVEFKRRNPRVGCPRIAQEIARAFGIEIDKDTSSAACSRNTIDPRQEPMVRPG